MSEQHDSQALVDQVFKLKAKLKEAEAEIDRLKNGLKNIKRHCHIVIPHGYKLMGTYRIAEDALGVDKP